MTTSPSTKVTRQPHMTIDDPATLRSFLEATPFCNVAFVENDFPIIIPMAFVNNDTHLFLHAYGDGRFMSALGSGAPLCISATLFDGLVLAKAGYSQTMNYRSVCVFGSATPVSDVREKISVLKMISDKYVPGRWGSTRQPTKQELLETMILQVPLTKISGKSRKGTPLDLEKDLDHPVWSGTIPYLLVPQAPVTDSLSRTDIQVPDNVLDVVKKGAL
ncbi:MAG: pyridoxamine 5'-phosphate oxidase family protein [Pseudomonadota bacterium]